VDLDFLGAFCRVLGFEIEEEEEEEEEDLFRFSPPLSRSLTFSPSPPS
jgi:hypothetical protein